MVPILISPPKDTLSVSLRETSPPPLDFARGGLSTVERPKGEKNNVLRPVRRDFALTTIYLLLCGSQRSTLLGTQARRTDFRAVAIWL